jgi:hypothetical protein
MSETNVRATVVVDGEGGVIGVGDHAIKKEAEKLAALSAVVQLCAAGLVSFVFESPLTIARER